MNKIYKVIWSKVKHQYVVVSELAHSNGKQSRTSRNSIRSRIAALVVCGAITAFGVYGTLPANSVFAAAAETVAGQYIAVAVDANNQGRYSIGDTRTFEDAQGKTHNYTWVNVDGKNYWVREGYTITIENGSRFTAYDKWGNPIAPDNTYIIDSQKSDSADSEGLISSSQVVIGDDSAHTTLTGNKLNSIDAGIYGGAVNTGGTQVPSSFNYYINDNGNGWKDVGEETSVSSMDNFKKVYKMADGTYNTDRRGKGTTVSTDNLYVIDGELGAFFNSNGSVYTGNVYGHNNEVLMTGVENGTYYSYWGTEINDPNTSLSEMTVGDLKKIVGGINDTIYTAQGDDIKQVSVQKSGDNGGTIGLIRRGDWNGTAYEKTDPVPGTITVTSTGGEGKDVAIQFSNDKGSFTVDAGSKVVANNGAGGTDLETISVNGQTFNVIGGAISGQIDSEGNVKIQQGNKVPVTIGKVSDWNVKSGQINGSTLTLTTENAYDGNPKTGTVTIEGVASTNYVDAKDALNVKYDSAEKTSVTLGGKTGTPVKLTNVANGTTTYDAVNFSQLEAVQNAENYVTSGSINNENGTITLNRVQGGDVTIEGLSQYVANKDEYATSAELNGSELTINRHLGEAIKVDLSQLTSGLSGTDYQVVANPAEGSDGVYSVSADGTLKLTVKDLNNPNAEAKEVSINGIAQKDYVDAKDALNVKYDSAEKTSVTLGGKTGTPVKLTNVANGTTTYDAVNFSQLEAVQNAENYVTSGSINNENGTITLNRVQGGDVTIEGLSQYVANKDEYATSAELNGSELTINRHLGEAIKVDLSQLTSGLSGTDYQVVANPAEGSDGVYSVSADGTLKLTVKDLNNPNAEAKEVSINGIAQKDYVDAKDALNVKYDSADKTSVTLGGKGSKTPVKLTNVANGTSTYDAVNFSQLEAVQNAEDYVTSGSIDNANGTITLNRVQGGDVTISGLQDYVNGKDSYVTAAKLEGNKLTITQNNQGKEFSIDLSGLTSGLSGTDYQLVANPINGSGGKYTVDDNGNLTLTVKDLNNPNAATKTITITGLAKKTDVAVVHGKYREGEANNLVDTNAQIWDEAIGVEKSSSIALGNGAFVSVQNGRKADAILFGSDTYTGGIAIGENSKALNATVNIGVKDYKGKMGDVDLSDYKTYEAMGVGETSIGSNSYISGSLSTNIGSYNITTTKYGNTSGILGSLYSAQNFGSVIVGTLNSIESNSSSAGMTSGVANSVIGMANKTQNSNGSLVFGTGNEITNSTASIPSPSSVSGDVADVAENFRDSVSDRNKSNGGAVLAIGGGNKADYAQNSQLIGVQNEITGTSRDISKFNMINGYQNTITNGSNDTVIGTKNTVTNGDSNVVLGDNHAVQDANNNVILGSSDKETTHTASDTVVIGHNAQANGNNDVAIGSGSIANGAVGTEGYAGANPIGTVSVGSEGNERTITNVAAGRINEDSTDAVNGSQLYATNQKVDAGWTATDGTTNIAVNPTETGTTTLKFAGDNNIAVTADAENNAINVELNPDVNLKGEGKNSDNRVWLSGSNGTITVTTENNLSEKTTVINGGNVYVGSSVSVGDKVEITDKDITGLSNTSWNGTTDDESRAATEGQLKDVSDTVNAGWTATDSNGASIVVNPENGSTLNFAGDRNIEVKANEKDGSIDVSLKDDMVLGGKEDTSRVEIGGTNGTSNTEWNGTTTTPDRAATEGQLQQVSNDVNAGWIATDNNGSQVNITPDNNKLNFAGDENITVTAANNEIKVALNDDIVLGDYLNGDDGVLIGGSSGTISATNSITVGEDQGLIIDGQKKEIQGLSNTTWNEKIANDAAVEGSTAASTAATQGQLQEVSKVANAGWTASDGTNSISVKPNETLNFVGDENLTVSADGTDKKLKVSLNDNITLGEGPNQIQLNGAPGANDPALSVGTDKFVVDQDGSLSVSDKFNVDAETGNIYAANNSGSAIMMNDDSVALNAGGNGIAISDEGILLNTNGINEDIKLVTKGTSVSVDSNGTTFTNTNTGETTNINGGTITTNTVKGLDNTTWSEDLAEEVANNEELQGTAATQGQLQQAVSEVAEVANAGWNAKAGGNIINVKPNETLNFEGDGNITVSATSGTSSELKFGLNHNITLDNVENEKTMMVFNTDGREGYIPDNYKEDNGQINDFIEEHGGFAIYYANPSLTTGDMTGTFGVTTDGVVHAKDVISYYSASSGSQSDVIRYSLNDVGDIVTQISHAVFDEGVGSTGMEYTLISDFEDEADKDSPFDAKEGKTRTIGLAVRQDGAVIVGAVVNDEGISSDRGIRINAETKTTYDKNGNEVTNNIATITGLENTEWKPPTPVATFAANDGSATVTSRAATESQLNDLYSAVAAYDVNVDGTIDYSHIALAGTPYGASRSGNGTHTGGTSITNVAYASGKDGSEAVNVDYLNDAISDAAENGSISTSDQHLVANTETGSNGVYKPNDDGNVNLIVSDEKGNSSTITIGDVASKEDLDNLKDDVGDLDYSKVEGDTIIDGDSVTDAIGKLDNKIDNITGTATDADNNTVTGGKINSDGTISLTQKDKDSIKLEGQLTDSGVVQEGTSFDKETGTITITSQDKYSGETSSVKVEGIASTEVVGATNKEDLATAYKDADKDGNATTEYITDSESMVEADVALDHAIQDVAGTSYANDMVLSNRIDSVEKRLGNVEERIDKVGAMAAAIANLRTMGFDPEAPTEIAIGVGQYKSETGIAIGVFHYPNQDFMLSASLSSSGDELMGGIGATWKLGRKSAAERAKDEEARHLEQAEEMKKLAQQEKVKAQAQRHAKLLAERQQASQKNA